MMHQTTTNVGLTMMNDGRHQNFAFKQHSCCCFGSYQQQQQCPNSNLQYYQNYQNWNYNNNEYEYNQMYQSSTTEFNNWSKDNWQKNSNDNSENNWGEYYSYPTPPTPAGSTISASSAENCPPSVAPSMQSLPSEHYPPTPYSVDLSSPGSSTESSATVYTNMGFVPESIPLHELIGAADDLLESMESNEKAQANKPKNTCSTSSSINTAESFLPPVAETAAIPPVTAQPPPLEKQAQVAEAAAKYDAKQLQKCLGDACEDWFLGEERKDVVRRLLKRRREASPPNLEESIQYGENQSAFGGPPKLEKQTPPSKKVKTIRLTFNEEKKQNSSQIQFNFACSCNLSWPLNWKNVNQISQHLSTLGTAPLLKSTRTNFSQFFQHFSFKVRLLVNPKNATVSTKTVLTCNSCPKNFDLENVELANLVATHVKSHLSGEQKSFCVICDRKVADLNRHNSEYFSIHQSRISNLATCFHPENAENLYENECKKCGHFYKPDPKLPDWFGRNSCQNCLEQTLEKCSKSNKVVLCQFCRQGRFGFETKVFSICLSCFKLAQAFQKMTDQNSCQKYVQGMLNELVKQLGTSSDIQEDPKPTFSLKQLLQSSVLEKDEKLSHFQSFSLHNQKTVEAVNAMNEPSENLPKFNCSTCKKSDFQNWNQIAGHLENSGSFSKHLCKSLDQILVIYTKENGFQSCASVLRCRKCKFYLPTNSDRQIESALKHVEECGNPETECEFCGKARALHKNGRAACAQKVSALLALKCNNDNKAVTKSERILMMEKCLNILMTFPQEESIEELIVASKQRSKRQ